VKTLRSQKLRVLLTHRKLLQSKAIAIENDLRATLRNFGLKVGMVGTVKFEARIICKIWYLISRTVSEDDAHRGNNDDRSVGAFAVKARVFGAPLCGIGA
jgi:hypothetical protein